MCRAFLNLSDPWTYTLAVAANNKSGIVRLITVSKGLLFSASHQITKTFNDSPFFVTPTRRRQILTLAKAKGSRKV